MPSVEYTWQTPEPIDPAVAEAFSTRHGLGHPVVAGILLRRGLDDASIDEFLHPSLDGLLDPFGLRNMDAAVRIVEEAIAGRRRICIYGDYDVDGTTSSALLASYLRHRGADVVTFIPLRSEGYGLSAQNVRRIAAELGPEVLITVDCGTSSREEVQLAKRLGMEVVVTDHHPPTPGKLSDTIVVNPHGPGDTYENKDLAGVGVAYKLVAALEGGKHPVANLDLVAMGTVADLMRLTGENRALVRAGLSRLGHTHRPGLAALVEVGCRASRIEPVACTHGSRYCVVCGRGQACRHPVPLCLPVRASTVGYQIGPRINAMGRIGKDQNVIVELFLTEDRARGAAIVAELDHDNKVRRELTDSVETQALATADLSAPVILYQSPDLVVDGADGATVRGIAGLVAGRLVEATARPAIVIGPDGDGSARSIEGLDLRAILQADFSHLCEAAGHAGAMGIKRVQDPGALAAALAAHDWPESLGARELRVDAVCSLRDIDYPLVRALDALEPTGRGNRPPLFSVPRARVLSRRFFSDGKHVRLMLVPAEGRGYPRSAVWFKAQGPVPEVGELVDVAGEPFISRDRDGSETVELRVTTVRRASEPAELDAAA